MFLASSLVHEIQMIHMASGLKDSVFGRGEMNDLTTGEHLVGSRATKCKIHIEYFI